MKHLTLITLLLIAGCGLTPQHPAGRWQLRRIEIFKNNHLHHTIEEGAEFWEFTAGAISIRYHHQVRQLRNVRRQGNVLTYSDTAGIGNRFCLHLPTDTTLLLTARQTHQGDAYTIRYYLAKATSH